jgi:glycosyltransferase involved in cell wall biosynthesis
VEGFLGAAIESVLGQSVVDWELLIVDDGSTDASVAVARAYLDPRIRVFAEEHRGAAGALNFGLMQARGDFVTFLDGDDLWEPWTLERHLALMAADPECEVSFGLSRMITEDSRDLGPTSRSVDRALGEEDLFVENYCANGSSVMLRRRAVERAGLFAEGMPGCYDYEYWLRAARGKGKCVRCADSIFVRYRRRRGQITGRWQTMERGWQMLLSKTAREHPRLVEQWGHLAEMNMRRYFAALALEEGSAAAGRQQLALSWEAAPREFLGEARSYWALGACLAAALLPAGVYRALEGKVRRWK